MAGIRLSRLNTNSPWLLDLLGIDWLKLLAASNKTRYKTPKKNRELQTADVGFSS